jgi:hypothetical protein
VFGLTFLNPAFLFASLAAVLPFLIHLLNRRKPEIFEFSSLRFIKELQKKEVKRIRLRQILLLIIRSLLILAIVLAVSRPTLKGSLSAHARSSVCILIDNSMSMGAEGPETTVFESALMKAGELASLLEEGDEAYLFAVSDVVGDILNASTHSPERLADEISRLEVSMRATNLVEALAEAGRVLANSRNPNREIYLITDNQESGWRIQEDRVDLGEEIDLFIFEVPGPASNLSLDSLNIVHKFTEPGEPIRVSSLVRNWTSTDKIDLVARFYLDGEERGQLGVDVGAGGAEDVAFFTRTTGRATHTGWVELPGDALTFDDKRFFTFSAGQEINVVVAGSPEERSSDGFFVSAALNPMGSPDFPIQLRSEPVTELASVDPSTADVVILCDPGRLTASSERWLRAFLADGGGALAILGDRTDARSLNESVLPELFGIRVQRFFSDEITDAGSIIVSSRYHPLVSLITGLSEDVFRATRCWKGFECEVVGSAQTVLSFARHGPALVYSENDEWKTAALLTGIDPAWNNLATSAVFLPLLHETVKVLSGISERESGYTVGQTVRGRFTLPSSEGAITVIDPEGSETLTASAGADFTYGPLTLPGIYRFASSSGEEVAVAVNTESAESNLQRMQPDDIRAAIAASELSFVDHGANARDAVLQERYGRELWRVFLWAALVLMAAEVLVGRLVI